MLNLVQLQERLKDMPMQALMQYANGANPQVPPFLALGELNRRKKMQESAAAQQAQEAEGAPSVKDQIEQAAGLLSLQGSRQRQAAQQQAGIQAAMPMAAPNTTTSEPAQMAGGGFVDDIVVPRDYQMGGQVQPQMNPEILKRLMMLKAMKQRQGLQGINPGANMNVPGYAPGGSVIDPEYLKQVMYKEAMQGDIADIPKELLGAVRKAALRRAPGLPGLSLGKDMFSRADYAGGGIVAFDGTTNGSLVRYDPEKDVVDESEPASSLAELIGKILPGGRKLITEKKFKDPKTGEIVSYDDYMARVRENERRDSPDVIRQKIEQTKNTGSTPEMKAQADAQQSIMANMVRPSAPVERSATPGAEPGIAGLTGTPKVVQDAITRALGLDVSTLFKAPAERTFDQILAEERRRQGLSGISEDFLDKRERALADIQARRETERAEQPMDRLMAMLAGIAKTRGGTMGTQGAAGAEASMALEAQQRALRDKQDMEMQDLMFTVAAKRDAIRRGDKAAAEALEEKEQKQRFEIAKTKAERIEKQGELASQEKFRTGTVAVQAKQAESTEGLRRGQAEANIENARTRALNEGTELIDRQIQALTTSGLPLNDKQKAELAQLQQKRDLIRSQINAQYDSMITRERGSGGFRVIGVKPAGQ